MRLAEESPTGLLHLLATTNLPRAPKAGHETFEYPAIFLLAVFRALADLPVSADRPVRRVQGM
jgi:hypothetical protein